MNGIAAADDEPESEDRQNDPDLSQSSSHVRYLYDPVWRAWLLFHLGLQVRP